MSASANAHANACDKVHLLGMHRPYSILRYAIIRILSPVSSHASEPDFRSKQCVKWMRCLSHVYFLCGRIVDSFTLNVHSQTHIHRMTIKTLRIMCRCYCCCYFHLHTAFYSHNFTFYTKICMRMHVCYERLCAYLQAIHLQYQYILKYRILYLL